MPVLPEIIFADTPDRIFFMLQVFDPFCLFFLRDMQEKFHDQITIIGKLALKTSHTLDPFCIILIGKFSVQLVFYDLIHPARIEKYELSLFRDPSEIAV